jgi:hypothetical protein
MTNTIYVVYEGAAFTIGVDSSLEVTEEAVFPRSAQVAPP